MTAAPAVTFVVPARDAAATISETLNSILLQTREDWRVITVIDRASDESLQVASEFLKDRRFGILQTDVGSASGSRNLGASHATTPWLVFLDSDDLVQPDYLAEMLGQAEHSGATGLTAVYCSGQKMTADGRRGPIERPPTSNHLVHLSTRNIFYTHGVMLSYDTFKTLGGFRTSLATCEDWEFWIRMFRAGAQVLETDHSLAIYRLREGSLISRPHTVLKCASQVIRRALACTAGGRPLKRGEERASRLAVARNQVFCLALWTLGLSVGKGEADETLLRNVMPGGPIGVEPLSTYFVDGVARGACRLTTDWPILWTANRSAIERLVGSLSMTYPDLAEWAAFLHHLEQQASLPVAGSLQ